jgi:hypothetical protein
LQPASRRFFFAKACQENHQLVKILLPWGFTSHPFH